MLHTHRIDVASIDHNEFNVSARGNHYLITPRPGKVEWKPEEIHLRSLLVNKDGWVLSSGFPKFPNYGEWPDVDAQFRVALQRGGEIFFYEKLDGTLIIADVIDRKPHFRTRGSHDLGPFEEPVMSLIRERYPQLLLLLTTDPKHDLYSFLFEYTAPDNRIVVQYDEPRLTLLSVVNKVSLVPEINPVVIQQWAQKIGVPCVRRVDLPRNEKMLVETVSRWKGREGIVAAFRDTDLGVRLVKIKTEEYKRLHYLRFRIEGKADQLAFLLNIESEEDIMPKLAGLGFDFEMYEFVKAEILAYLERRNQALEKLERFQAKTRQLMTEHWGPDREDKKAFVQAVRDFMVKNPEYENYYFHAAMRHWDGRMLEALAIVLAHEVLDLPVNTVIAWLKDRQAGLNEVLNVTTDEDV